MIYIRCQDVYNKGCRYIATSTNQKDAIEMIINHAKKEHPHILKNMDLEKLSILKNKIRKSSYNA